MRRSVFIFVIWGLIGFAGGSVFAQTCPQVAKQAELTQELLAGLQSAKNELAAKTFSDQLWRIWITAPDEKAQAMLDAGLEFHRAYNFDAAERAFTELVLYCPDYAEGYNQRAFVNFLRGNFDAALDDLELALERSPLHVAALAGKALTLLKLGQDVEGQKVLRAAVDLNPWLSERALLKEIPGKDI